MKTPHGYTTVHLQNKKGLQNDVKLILTQIPMKYQ